MEEQSNMQRGVIMASEGELAAVVMLNALFSAHGISIFFAKNCGNGPGKSMPSKEQF